MFAADRIYSLDIETDTNGVNGLDPREARITEVSVSIESADVVFDQDDEAELLYNLDRYLRGLPPGLISTWNGTFFDIPFIHDRLAHARLGVIDLESFGMHLIPQPGLIPKYDFLPGHTTGYGATWRTDAGRSMLDVHQFLDISDAYRAFAKQAGVRHGLKPVCTAQGIDMIEVDRLKMHELTPQQRHDYAVSDTQGTRELTLRLLGVSQSETP